MTRNQRTAGAALLAVYTGSVVAANWLTTRYGLISVGFGLVATAGTPAIGGVIMTRDLLQDAIGRWWIFAAIAAGGALSWAVASHQIARASFLTFLLAETVTWAVYWLRSRFGWGTGRWAGVVVAANLAGAVADTFLFLWLAGFPLTRPVVEGQLLGKVYVTAAVVCAGVMIRRARILREPQYAAGAGSDA